MAKDDNKKPRRDYGGGSLYFRESDRRWVGSFYHNGERKYVYGSVGGKKAEASRKLKEAQQKAEQGKLVAANKQKIAEYLEYWLEVRRLPSKPNTYKMQSSHMRVHVIPALGKIPLQKLSRQQIQQFIQALLDEGLKPSSIHTIYTVFHTAMRDAVEWEMLAMNPCKKVTLPRWEERDYVVLDAEQVQVLLRSLVGNPLESIITVALATGMRRSELLALKWSDVDMSRGRLRVQRSVSLVRKVGYQETSPKTKASKRSVTLTETAHEALKAHRHNQLQTREEAPEWKDLDLVFPGVNGGYLPFATLNDRFKRALASADLPLIRFHDLRHTCATLLLSMGASPKVVQELLGHSSIRITMDLYGHVIPGMQESAMLRYDEYLKINRDG